MAKTPKYAIAIDLGLAEIWLGQKLVNGGPCRRFAAFAAGLYQELQFDKRRWESSIFARAPLVSEDRAGGSARVHEVRKRALAFQGFHHFDRLFALPSPHDWASVPPPPNSPIRIFYDHFVPGNENRPARWPGLRRRDRLSRDGFARQRPAARRR